MNVERCTAHERLFVGSILFRQTMPSPLSQDFPQFRSCARSESLIRAYTELMSSSVIKAISLKPAGALLDELSSLITRAREAPCSAETHLASG